MENLSSMTDEQLALLYIEGNNAAFDLLLERNQRKVFQYILCVVHDEDKANDVFQETFVKAITKMHERHYAPTGKFSSWLIRIAHNILMDEYRISKQQRHVCPNPENDLSNLSDDSLLENCREGKYVNDQILRDVERIMYHLPLEQREVVWMRYYQDMSFKEIAETTGVSINTSLGRMRYAIMNMRRMARVNNIELSLS